MDKSWINEDRNTLKYEMGVETFLIFAEENASNPKRIPCPCSRCVNFKKKSIKVIRGHLFDYGFSLGYTNWIWHAELTLSSCASAPIGSPPNPQFCSETVNMCEAAFNEGDYDEESYEFNKFVEEAETLTERDELDTFAFIDPAATYNCERSGFGPYLVDRLKEGKADRIFFMPYNPGEHWILTIIWEDEVYILDPLPKPVHYTAWETAVMNAVKSYNAKKGRANKMPKLRLLPGVPKQPGGIECGYYVMLYMKDIINDDTLSFSTKWAVKTRKGYTQQQLDEVRMEVADYLQTLL